MVYDTVADKYYAFVTSASSGYVNPSVQRLNFGANPHSTPVATNLGNPGNAFIVAANANMEAVELVLDETGIYHAFFCNRGIVHWVFGNGLGNPPTITTRIFDNPAILSMSMQMSVLKTGNQWIAFCGQTYGPANIVRFNLGADLNSIPATLPYTTIPAPPGGFGLAPAYFSILKENGQWVMMVAPLSSSGAPLYRYNFGASLQNNSPAVTNLGAPAPAAMSDNRGLNFIKTCDSFYMLGLNQNGTVLSFNFQNNITTVPTAQSLGNLVGTGVNAQVLKPYWYKDTLWALTGNWNNNATATVYRMPLLKMTSGQTTTRYYNPATTYTFTSPGVYNVKLYCDQGDPRGPQAFCKQIIVTDTATQNQQDTALCAGQDLQLGRLIPGTANYLWNTGATTPTITIQQSGTYWVQITGTGCQNGTDTIAVDFHPLPDIVINPAAPVICKGQSVKLNASGPAGSYSWTPTNYLQQPTSATPLAAPPVTTRYYVSLTDNNGCTGRDSVTVTVSPGPQLSVTSAETTVSCAQQWVQLQATGAATYQWEPAALCDNPAIADPKVRPTTSTTFYVKGTDAFGCTAVDSIRIDAFRAAIFFVPDAFSPNGDGLNDIFMPRIYCGFQLDKFMVYNRYGQQVYTTTKPDTGWDGTFNRLPADVGTYFWYIEGKDDKGQRMSRKGDVQLLR